MKYILVDQDGSSYQVSCDKIEIIDGILVLKENDDVVLAVPKWYSLNRKGIMSPAPWWETIHEKEINNES